MADENGTPSKFTRVCPTCAKSFTFGAGIGQARVFCSKDCRPPRPKPTKICDFPGCIRTARTDAAQHCEAHYFQIRRTGRAKRIVEYRDYGSPCDYCGQPVPSRNRFCGARCGARHARGNPLSALCVICGKSFAPIKGTNTCGPDCKAERIRNRDKRCYDKGMLSPAGRERRRKLEYRRKARKLNATVEDVSRDEVMRQSGWTCHLCMEPIPKGAKWPDPRFGTVDHVVPLALGGAHAYFSCKAAHLTCNCSKGAKIIGQLGLSLSTAA